MNRSLEIGDFVTISLPNYVDSHYVITNIDSNLKEITTDNLSIKNSQLKLVFDSIKKKWQVKGDNLDYDIQFSAHIFLSKNPEIDYNILLYLDSKSLETICELDEYTKDLCNDNLFWKTKFKIDYPDSPELENFTNYKKLYFLIENVKSYVPIGSSIDFTFGPTSKELLEWLVDNQFIDILKWLSNGILDRYIFQYGIPYIFKKSNIGVIEWFYRKYHTPNYLLIYAAIDNNRTDIIYWMISQNIYIIVRSEELQNAAANGYLDILKLIYDITNILPNAEGANYAFVDDYLDVVQWLESHNIHIDNNAILLAVSKNRLDKLKLLYSMGMFFKTSAANLAAQKGYLDILNYLETIEILPDIRGANEAYNKKQLDALKWLEKRNIYPDLNMKLSPQRYN